ARAPAIFYDNTSRSPFPTRLHLWLVGLGGALVFSRVGRPTDQVVVERSHQTWTQQVLQGQRFADWDGLYAALRTRRDFLNQALPCVSLENLAPLVAAPHAASPQRLYRPEWEADLLQVERVYEYLAAGHWFRRVSASGTVSLGG